VKLLPLWGAICIAAACGALAATQSSLNGTLAAELGDGYAASLISFGSGLMIIAIVMVGSKRGRGGAGRVVASVRSGRIRWWMLLGGLSGAMFVLSQGLTVAVLGVALFTVAVVAGQTASALLLDRMGLGPGGAHHVTTARALGAVLAIAAVILAVLPRLDGDRSAWAVLMPLIAGFAVSWQQAVNGRVRVAADSALTATFVNFAVGTVALIVAMLVHASIAGWPERFPSDPWLYTGGALGCVIIAVGALLVRRTGVLLLGLSILAGQLGASVVFELVAPIGGEPKLDPWTVSGAVVALCAVFVASIRHIDGTPKPADAGRGS
jgi:bacterial/archaeal transporter family-2 protein